MNKLLCVLLVAAAPAISFAAEDAAAHAGHGMQGHDMQAHEMQGHDMSQMGDMHSAAASSVSGQPGDPAKVSRTIEVVVGEGMRYTPSQIQVKAGETVRLFVKNTSKVRHEMALGSTAELKAHAEMMRQMPGMQHDDPSMLNLNPGQRGSIVWRFDKAGTVDFACMVPGHWDAGMAGKIQVE